MNLLSFRTRLLISFWLVLAPALCFPAVYLYHSLESGFIAEAEKNALTHLRFIGWLMEKDAPSDSKGLDRWCTDVGKRLGYRITVIKPGGTVIADSDVGYPEIRFMENHAKRPEIVTARSGKPGFSVRNSPTLKRKLIYAAEKLNLSGGYPYRNGLYLRVALPLSGVEAKIAGYGNRFFPALVIVFLFTLAVSLFLSKRLERPLHSLIRRIESVGSDDFSHDYIMDAGKEFFRLSSAVNDMSDRISSQVEEINRQKADLSAILENLKEGVMLISPEGRIKAINAALSEIAAHPGTCIGKQPIEAFMVPEVQTVCDGILATSAKTGASVTFPHGGIYEIYAVPTIDHGAVMVFYDISERTRVEKIRQDFVANVSHELKTPLTSIKGYIETLVSGDFVASETGRKFLSIIEKNADRMISMVNDLLALTHLEQHSVKKSLGPVDAGDCVVSALETIRPMADEKNIHIENTAPEGIAVMADNKALIRVFQNLMNNAVTYSPENGIIHICASITNHTAMFSVRDSGPGIPAPDQKRIFERFYRVDKERSRKSGGTGLGLSICRNAITQMGGKIWVTSPPEGKAEGSEFFFTLQSAS